VGWIGTYGLADKVWFLWTFVRMKKVKIDVSVHGHTGPRNNHGPNRDVNEGSA
jgi:hypothetical protein